MDLVDLVLQLFVRGKVFQKLLFLILAPSVVVLIITAQVTTRQLGLRIHIVGQSPAKEIQETIQAVSQVWISSENYTFLKFAN